MRAVSLIAVTLTALALISCGDETGPDEEANLKSATVAAEKATARPAADTISLKSHPIFAAAQAAAAAQESGVCGVRKRELAAVRTRMDKGVTPQLRSEEVSLNAIVADVCN